MDAANESFTISVQQTLLENQPPQEHKRRRSYRKTIIVSSLILVIIIAVSTILFYMIRQKKKEDETFNKYLSFSSRYYCDFTSYPEPCYESMSSVVSSTLLASDPTPIFTSSIQVSINEVEKTSLVLNRTMSFFSKISSSSTSTSHHHVESMFQNCMKWAKNSSNLLIKSFDVLGNDSDIGSLTYIEMDNVRSWIGDAAFNEPHCLLALNDDDVITLAADNIEAIKKGVEEVTSGVERATKCMVNSIDLWSMIHSILRDFHYPYGHRRVDGDYYYYYHYFDSTGYTFLAGMYSVMYLFLALLYYLFWHSKR